MAEVSTPVVRLDEPTRIHIVNVGGKAMSAMAEILVAMGHHVSGSDPNEVPVLDRLRNLGVEVQVGTVTTLPRGVNLLAYSTATPTNHPELQQARQQDIPLIGRPALQGTIARTRRTVAISGTHGKTSTTAMLVHILAVTGQKPSYMVGGDLARQAGGAAWDDGEWLVVEGDESDGTFLHLGAEMVVVTNVDSDHLDFYGSREAIESAFSKFLAPAHGGRIVGSDDLVAARLGVKYGAFSFGTEESADLRVVDVVVDRTTTTFSLVVGGEVVAEVNLPEPGLHNALNATAAISAAQRIGVSYLDASAALSSYGGVGRRFEIRGEQAGVVVIDDYAHNPGKVRAVVDAASRGGWDRVVVVFQPHRYSRTADLWPEFEDSFVGADVVVITAIDPAGEAPREGVSGRLIVDAVTTAHPEVEVHWVPEAGKVIPLLVDLLVPGDLCLTLGAGTITHLANELLPALRKNRL